VSDKNAILKKVAKEVSVHDFFQRDILDMKDIIIAKKAVGIAAPQIGISKRFFVMRPGVLWWVCINPIIISLSEETSEMKEGCLSLPGFLKTVKRPNRIAVKFFDEDWHSTEVALTGINARVFQHELDHLNGILINDI
jgi:peptide deformylase